MKAVVIDEPGRYSVREVPDPVTEKGEVKIKIHACCVCGTDKRLVDGEFGGAVYPLIPGHEFAGTVVELGPGARGVEIGDRVSVAPIIACGTCYHCKAGRPIHCLNGFVIGHSGIKTVKLDGAFAEYVVVPAANVFKLPDNVSLEEGAFMPNLSTAVSALRRARLAAGEEVLVFGTGTMGNLLAQLAKVGGASLVAVTGRSENRLRLAKELGADVVIPAAELEERAREVAPFGFDVVVEATGVGAMVSRALPFVKDMGRLVLFGNYGSDTCTFNPTQVARRNLEIIGSVSAVNVVHIANSLLGSGQIKVAPLISHHFPLADFAEAMALARDPKKCMRVIVNP
jgi:2-desacetyl-2-hydroxyethyl bacteriochlorophyllide A dehydrogenase